MRAVRRLTGPIFIAAGTLHFLIPGAYKRIMPPYVPAREAMVYDSGAAEIAGGAALMHPATRRWGGWWLIATLIAVFPANLHMALHPSEFSKVPGGPASLWARLPLQVLFVAQVRAAMGDPG